MMLLGQSNLLQKMTLLSVLKLRARSDLKSLSLLTCHYKCQVVSSGQSLCVSGYAVAIKDYTNTKWTMDC